MFVDRMGLAAKEFVKAYDSYTSAKAIIDWTTYNINKIESELSWYSTVPWTTQSVLNLLYKQREVALDGFEEKEELAKKLHYARNNHNTLKQPYMEESLNLGKWKQLDYVKSLYHQKTAELLFPNRKYVSIDWWHEEVVYNYFGRRVDDIQDVWTYNFFDPISEKSLHVLYDVSPYKEWWNWPSN